MRTRAFAVLSACLISPALAGAQIPVGAEFQVNGYTTGHQAYPAVAADADGNFVVAWYSDGQDGSSTGIFARRFLASGAPVGITEFRVNSHTTGYQVGANVASDPTGRIVIVWSSEDQDGSASGVYGRRYDALGAPGPEFRVNSFTTSYQERPAVAMDGDGDFVVVWDSYGADGHGDGIFAQRYNAAGVPQGGEFRVNSYTTHWQSLPSVAMDAAGNFVVAWESRTQDGSDAGIFAQRFDVTGVPQGPEFRVNSYTTGGQYGPSVAMDQAGNFVIVWSGVAGDGDSYEIFGQRYDAAGLAQGAEFQVNAYTPSVKSFADVAKHGEGGFLVTWTSFGQDGSDHAVVARAFDASGAPEGEDVLVNSFTTGYQFASSVAATPNGTFIVVWTSMGEDGDMAGVIGERFVTDLIFRDGFESGVLSAWSASQTDGGDLSVSSSAAMKFTIAGLQGVVDDTAALYVQDDSPNDEDRYRARFYFHTNGFDPGETQNRRRTRLFIAFAEAPTRRLAAVVLRRLGGAYSLLGRARLDDDSQHDTGFLPISDGPHFVELDWRRASGPDANDGSFELWIDGTSAYSTAGLDNDISAVDFVRLGALSVKAGANGTLYWDEFESRRLTYIGP